MGWPRASQVCSDTPHFLGKDIPMLTFLFCGHGGGGVQDGLEVIDTCLGPVETKVPLEEISH